jgi:hypothetical protein
MFNDAVEFITKNLDEWKKSVANPELYQKCVLKRLLSDYAKTKYGKKFGAESVLDIEDYREKFPIVAYKDIRGWLDQVRLGNPSTFLSEDPLTWVMTRGTTGESKILPVTEKHLNEVFRCGSRAVLNFSMNNGGFKLLVGGVLNLQFPSKMGVLETSKGAISYGFSSGTYAKLNPMMMGLHLIPRQEEIDELGTNLTREGWEARYEYIYQRAKDEEITSIIGVAPVQTDFARFLKKKHGVYPKDLWGLKVIYSTSVAKIQFKYKPKLQSMYGDVPLVEMYTATEGAYAQQKDAFPYVVPNFDTYFFEVDSGQECRMLHEMERGDWGSLVISSSMFPRYRIGDLVEAHGKNYFRVFGRDNKRNRVEHFFYRALLGWFL